jgi:hypothetical protein
MRIFVRVISSPDCRGEAVGQTWEVWVGDSGVSVNVEVALGCIDVGLDSSTSSVAVADDMTVEVGSITSTVCVGSTCDALHPVSSRIKHSIRIIRLFIGFTLSFYQVDITIYLKPQFQYQTW